MLLMNRRQGHRKAFRPAQATVNANRKYHPDKPHVPEDDEAKAKVGDIFIINFGFFTK